VADLTEALVGASVTRVGRRGKYLVFDYQPAGREEPGTWLAHLGMTGRMDVQPASQPLPRHVVVTVDLGEDRWVFEDARGFGRWILGREALAGMGPEPLSEAFTASSLAVGLRGSRQPIKVRLMDQSLVAGVGNIYASEALYRARISPRRAAGRLTGTQCEELCAALRAVLAEAVALGSSLPLAFANGSGGGTDGLFYYGRDPADGSPAGETFQVYGRAGSPCRQCGRLIRRWIQAGRSTFACSGCQR
jgi:formamidopyrimidine-DNA glycosylase